MGDRSGRMQGAINSEIALARSLLDANIGTVIDTRRVVTIADLRGRASCAKGRGGGGRERDRKHGGCSRTAVATAT